MKTNVNSWALFLLLIIVQLVMTNYLPLSQFVTLSLLPALIMCLPMTMPTFLLMVVAFATGMTVDFLAEGVVGLNTLALVPVAAMRNFVVGIVAGQDTVERGADFNFKKNGPVKVATIVAIPLAVFLLIFIAADGAGMRPFWFNLVRFTASLLVDLAIGMGVVKLLNPDDRR